MVKKQGRRARLKKKKDESRQQRIQCQDDHTSTSGSSSAVTCSSSAVTCSSSAVTCSSSEVTCSSSEVTCSSSAVTCSSSAETCSSSEVTCSSSEATRQLSKKISEPDPKHELHRHSQLLALVGDDETEISDDVIDAMVELVKAHCDTKSNLCVGFYTPAQIKFLERYPEYALNRPIPSDKNCILIHPLNGHWITSFHSANLQQVFVYDSLNNGNHLREIKDQISIIYGNNKADKISIESVTQQNHLPLCGVMAVAFLISLFLDNDPAKIPYDIHRARQHLRKSLASGNIESFPTINNSSVQETENYIEQNMEDLLKNYHKDQASKSNSKLRKREIDQTAYNSLLLPDPENDIAARKRKSRMSSKISANERLRNRENKKGIREVEHFREVEKLKQKLYRQKSRQNPNIREKERQKDKQYHKRLRQNKDIREKERHKEKLYHQRSRQSTDIREKERQKEKLYHQRSRQNNDIREKERQKEKLYHQRSRQNKDIREKERQKEKLYHQRSRQNKDIREKERQKEKLYHQRSRQSTDIREKERQKEKLYHQRSRQKKDIREKERQKEKLYHQRSRQKNDIREKERQKEKLYHQRSRQSTDIREKERQKDKQYHKRLRQNKDIREKERQKDKLYRHETRQKEDERKKTRQKQIEYRQKARKISTQTSAVITAFRKECKQMPCYTCSICYRFVFRKQVRTLNIARYPEDTADFIIKCVTLSGLHKPLPTCSENCPDCSKWVCFTCDRNLTNKKIPNQALENKLYLQPQDKCLKSLNQLEKHLVSPIIPFMKIIPLPKGQQKGVHGPVVCVPADMSTVTQVLPRQLSDRSLVKVKLKRKLQYKGHHLFQQVSMQRLKDALHHLKEINPNYADIILDLQGINVAEEPGLIIEDEPNELMETNHVTQSVTDLEETYYDVSDQMKSDQHVLTVHDYGDYMEIQSSAVNVSNNDLSKQHHETAPDHGDIITTEYTAEILPDDSNQMEMGQPAEAFTDKDLSKQHHETAPDHGDLITTEYTAEILPDDSNHMETGHPAESFTDKDLSKQHHETAPDHGDIITTEYTAEILPDDSNHMETGHPAESFTDKDLSKQHHETAPDHGDLITTEYTAEILPDDSNQMEMGQPAEAFTDKDLTETSTPMVSCLQQEDLQEVAAAQQHPDQHISVAPAEGQRPCSVFQETKVFPYLFPDGKNGFSEKRSTKLGLGRYVNSRLFSRDIRFACDPQYIFFCQYISELNNIQSSTSIAMRKGINNFTDGSKVTAQMLTNNESREKILKSDKGYQFLKAIRGSPPYWEKCLRDLFAMVRQLGVPTWFCSFSAADRRWPEIQEAICRQQNENVPEALDWTEYCKIINSNPVTACRMFENRVNAFISSVILSQANPVGKVVDYFYRTEFQSRGWPHIHCLFWCKDAPQFKSSGSNEEFLQYVDRYINCAMPNEDVDPELFELVSKVQMHSKNHSRSCKKGSKTCRFNFPRPISTKTFVAIPSTDCETAPAVKESSMKTLQAVWNIVDNINEHNLNNANEVLASINLSQEAYERAFSAISSRNTVIFKRDIGDLWVNPYNATLLKAWNGNMDIQPVLDAYSCIMYIVSYISKAERELGDILRKAQEEAKEGHLEPINQLRKLGNVYLNAREISIMESVYRACGMKLKQSSREVVFVPADENSAKLTKPLHVLQHAAKECEDIWMTSIIDRYLARPHTEEFEDMCLAKFVSQYRVKDRSNSEHEESNKVIKLLNNKGSITKRKKLAVIRYTNHNKNKNSEKYYHNIIIMYLPHRERNIKLNDEETYEEIFQQNTATILRNMEPFEKLTADLSDAWKRLQEGTSPDDIWADIASNQETTRLEDEEELETLRREFQQDAEEIDPEDIPDHLETNREPTSRQFISSTSPKLCKNEHLQKVRSLNLLQEKFFQYVKNWAERKESEDVDPFYLFLTGGAGTGKSHTIRCIYNEVDRTITRKSENAECPVVLLVAYTGTAAYNIGGQTIHSALKINHHQHLNEETANTLRARLQDLQLLIIDEISMVSRDLLNLIHCRLQQIKRPSKPDSIFGGISVLTVGDFYQVPPVKGMSLISINNSLTDLWSHFSIWELTEVVRQKGDTGFIEMLNRLRKKSRENDLNANDAHFLKSKIISKDSPDYPVNTLHIASTHKQLDKINQEHIQNLSGKETMFNIQAADICHDKKTNTTFKKKEPIEVSKPALPANLSLCVGARVMLTQNLDVLDGLTNGVLGTVTAIIPGPMKLGLPSAVCVLFDQPNVGTTSRTKNKPPVNINPQSTVVRPQTEIIRKSPEQITRHQFPFILAWAVTIHKTQGLTTDQVIVSLKGIFKAGMGYVALSRVTSASGLYLLDTDFDISVIYADKNVHRKLQEMTAADSLPDWKNVHALDEVTLESQNTFIASLNCEGYNIHIPDLAKMQCFKIADVVALQETWTSNELPIKSVLSTHNIEVRHRSGSSSSARGGVAILINQDFDYTVIDTSMLSIEALAIHIKSPELSVVSVYRPPTMPLGNFLQQMACLLQNLPTEVKIIAGDFNVNIRQSPNKELQQVFSCYDQVISEPTTRKRTLIDHIYVNKPALKSGVVQTYFSYHHATYVMLDCDI